MAYQLAFDLEDKIREKWEGDTGKLFRIGDRIYTAVAEQLEKEFYGKYAVIISGMQSQDGRDKILITDPPQVGRGRIDIIDEVKKEYPNAIPYLRFIGKPEDNPALMHV